MQEYMGTINSSKCLITGYGRIGEILAQMLKGLGADVYVSARRKESLAWIKLNGYKPVEHSNLINSGDFDIIFNTVPAHVVGKEVLDKQSVDTLIIDLASSPGGIDFDYAKNKNIRTIHALSLPSKCAPVTAANIAARVIYDYISEMDG
jgi:dipicolinate synthase subunit A